ncbi:MAG: alanine--glyoxylate aminotransferase family protein [Chloroflexota bacterium]|nr:MAG: alanine--glyoxylate aminotransferase family protein [Chloroflexota bacterium]
MNLRIPGPTPCPPEVLAAMSGQMVNHRGPEFSALLTKVTGLLKEFFQTSNDLLTLTTSGTGALEAAVVNTLSPGDKVLSVVIGNFGERFAEIARVFGAEVVMLQFEWGTAADPEAIRQALHGDPAIKAVLVTHNETSTGVTNDLHTIAKVVKEFDKLLLVDAISSIGSIDLPVDAWSCDVVVTGSQKGWMVPPGLAFASVSPAAWEAFRTAKMPRFYFDFGKAKKFADKGQTPWTPAISLYYALGVSLELMKEEGFQNIIARHTRVASYTRKKMQELGLSLFADEHCASNTVTAVNVPQGVNVRALLKILKDKYGVVLSAGQGKIADSIFRVGHLGYVGESDIDAVYEALRESLSELGCKVPLLT